MGRRVDLQQVRTVFDDHFRIDEAELAYELPDGRMSTVVRRLSLERGDSAAAVVVDLDAGTTVLTRQFRFATFAKGPGWLVELVAGSMADDETPGACICREIGEELGYAPTSVTPITTFYTSPGGSSERVHLFHVEVTPDQRIGRGGGNANEQEDIEMLHVPLDDVPHLLQSGEIMDAKTIVGLTWLVGAEARSRRDA